MCYPWWINVHIRCPLVKHHHLKSRGQRSILSCEYGHKIIDFSPWLRRWSIFNDYPAVCENKARKCDHYACKCSSFFNVCNSVLVWSTENLVAAVAPVQKLVHSPGLEGSWDAFAPLSFDIQQPQWILQQRGNSSGLIWLNMTLVAPNVPSPTPPSPPPKKKKKKTGSWHKFASCLEKMLLTEHKAMILTLAMFIK